LLLIALLSSCAHADRPLPVVFIHGNGANAGQWRHQAAYFSKSRPVVTIELPGMGKAAKPADGDYSVEAMARHVHAMTTTLGLERFVLVGHSYGGAVVAAYAAKHPQRVAAAVYADAGGTIKMSDEAAEKFLAALRKDKDKLVRQWFAPILKPSSDAVREEVFASVAATPIDVFAGALSGLRFIDMESLLKAYPGPVLAIVAPDIASPGSLHKQIPSLPVREIPNAGHWLMLDQPDEFNRVLGEFLAGVERPASRQAGRLDRRRPRRHVHG
jgi:pimeloyl-ACP methyl ester carboxylesterase